MRAHRQTNKTYRRTLSGKQFDSVRVHVGPGRSAGVAGCASRDIAGECCPLFKSATQQAFLARGQSISHTGSFGRNVASGELYWSAETYNIFEHDRAVKPTLEMILRRTHPDDRDLVLQTLDRESETRADFELEHRLLMPNGSVKHLHVSFRVVTTTSGNLEFVGAVTDVTAAKEAEEKIRQDEHELRS